LAKATTAAHARTLPSERWRHETAEASAPIISKTAITEALDSDLEKIVAVAGEELTNIESQVAASAIPDISESSIQKSQTRDSCALVRFFEKLGKEARPPLNEPLVMALNL
jgi:hypothetical protein